MKLIWYGHSCFKISSISGSIIFDPFKNNYIPGVKNLPSPLSADYVICSHNHDDHNASELVLLSGKKRNLNIKTIDTFHDEQKGQLRGKNKISLLDIDGLKLIHYGDLGCDLSESQIEILKNANIALIPVGGFYTIDSEKAAKIIKQTTPKIVIPMHYRGNGFGFKNIATVDKFLSFCSNVNYYNSNKIQIDENTKSQTAVLSLN